jgi:predicted DNA binding protein
MAVVDARIRVHHPCPYCDLSVRFPRSLFLLWCDNRRDTFLVSSPEPSETRAVVAALRRSLHARPLLADPTTVLVEVPDFEWASPPSVTGLARRTGVWVLPPVVYSEGRETYRLVASGRARLQRLLRRIRRLGEVEILSLADRAGLDVIRDFPTASVHFFEGLTDRQSRVLVAAHDAGLLEIPARTSWAEAARREGLSRSTFGEHLRKAQLRLLRNSYAILKARAAVPSGPPVVLPRLEPARGDGRPAASVRRPARRPVRRGGSARRT